MKDDSPQKKSSASFRRLIKMNFSFPNDAERQADTEIGWPFGVVGA
jgi:hypothetical protein